MPSNLEWALNYLEYGFSVLPLRFTGDAAERKRPLIPTWEPYQKERASEELVRAWFRQWPEANVGIITGAVSGLVAIDLDGPRAATLLTDKGLFLPPTAAVRTGNGHHAIFSYGGKEKIPNSTKLLTDGNGSSVDVRGEGGYIVAPPSIHGSGHVYTWVRDLGQLLPLPSQLEDYLLGVEPQVVEEDWWKDVEHGVTAGSRNDAAARVAGYWMRMTNSEEATLRATLLWNTQNDPPLSEEEIRITVGSVAKKHKKNNKETPRQTVVGGAEWGEELRTAEPRKGIAIPMPGIDMIDGLVPGDLVVVAGRPGIGKSTFGTQLTAEAMKLEVPTLVISSEMTKLQWGRWVSAVLAEVPVYKLPRPLGDDVIDWFKVSPVSITDVGTIAIDEIRKLAEGIPGLKLLVVDHLTRILPSKGRSDRRDLEVGEVARGLKSMAKDLGITVVALVQLNRQIEARARADGKVRPQLSDLRDSGEIEQEADAVLFIYSRTDIDKSQNERTLSLVLEKHRHGPQRYAEVLLLCAERKFIGLAKEL